MLSDLRYAVRMLRRSPGFALAALVTLALGIGASTAVFTVLDAVVLRPLPYRQPDRLVMFWDTNASKGLTHEPISPVTFLDYRGISAVEDAAAWWRPDVNLIDEAHEPVRVNTVEASSNLFAVLGVSPMLGPGFGVADGPLHKRGATEVVISRRVWQNRFGGDASIVGRTIELNGAAHTVLGVMPDGFHFPGDTDVWQRLNWDLSQHSRGAHFMESVARLRPGVTLAQAQADLTALGERVQREFASTNAGWSVRVAGLDREIAGFFRPALALLFGAVTLLLVIACANVANLLLARAAGREREVALRAAIGASRQRLVRQLLTESGVLAALGALLGLAIAAVTVRAVIAWAPTPIPRIDHAGVDLRALAFAALAAATTTMAFGLTPALAASRADLVHALKEGGRGAASGARGQRTRSLLVVLEVALAVMLLIGAALITRSVVALARADAGVQPGGVLTVSLQLSGAGYREWPKVAQFYGDLLDALRQTPALRSAGASNFLPLEAGWRIAALPEGRPPRPAEEQPSAQIHSVDEGYFDTLAIARVRGRTFSNRDTAATASVVVINEAMARVHWPGEDPVGRRLVVLRVRNIGPLGVRLTTDGAAEVVGVVKDVKNTSLSMPAEPAVYFAQRQFPFRNMHIMAATRGDAAAAAAALREQVRRLDPTLPLSDIRTMNDVLGASVENPRFVSYLMGGFSTLALLLAAVGIYGVLAYAVGQRRQEISVRMALGASPVDVVWMVLRHGLTLTAAGAVLGVAGAAAGARLIASLLFDVSPTDGIAFATVFAVALVATLAACAVPAWRAARVDPIAGLRAD